MPFILIKNHMKLMLRNKWILLMMTILPIITIALLSNAFRDMLDTVHKVDEFQVGYRISEDSAYKAMLPQLKSVCDENGIILLEYPDGDINQLMKNKTVAAFANIADNSYTIYKSEAKKIEATITESIFSSFFYQVNSGMTLMSYSIEKGSLESSSLSNAQIKSEKLDTDPVPSSIDYYGIIYIVYGAWCGMFVLASVVSSERKGSVLKRMRVSHISRLNYYIGKFIPGALAIFIEVCIAWILTVLLLDIHWGNIAASVFIIFLTSMAAAALGIFLYQLCRSMAISIVIGFVLTWVMGFFGGTFQSYMYNMLPSSLTDLSPFYYVNRTLVEYSTKGASDFTGTCVIYLLIIIVAFGIFGTLLINRKLEEVV